jgi:hypothetical protein
VTGPGVTLHVLRFSDQGPATVGQEELSAAFKHCSGWFIAAIEPARIDTRFGADGLPAWLATIKRTASATGVREGPG